MKYCFIVMQLLRRRLCNDRFENHEHSMELGTKKTELQ